VGLCICLNHNFLRRLSFVQVTIRYGNAQAYVDWIPTNEHTIAEPTSISRNIAEQLIEKGLATALRHRRDDESRSSEYDKLMAAEQK
jgi:hypothetical protein